MIHIYYMSYANGVFWRFLLVFCTENCQPRTTKGQNTLIVRKIKPRTNLFLVVRKIKPRTNLFLVVRKIKPRTNLFLIVREMINRVLI